MSSNVYKYNDVGPGLMWWTRALCLSNKKNVIVKRDAVTELNPAAECR